jgi:thiamine biosynthesis lipoprotein
MNFSIILLKMRYIKICIAIAAILAHLSCVNAPGAKSIERVQYQMGTYARIEVMGGDNGDVDAAFNKIKELDNLLSDYNPKSEVSEINNMAGVKAVRVDDEVIRILEIAKEVAFQTDGAFDPTIGALTIGVYRFGREGEAEIDLDEIDRAKSLVNYKDLIINGNNAYLKNKGMMIDLGGIGKGLAVDRAVSVLKQRGVRSGVVSLSGDIKVFGESVDIAIKNPYNESPIATFKTGARDLAISTSGGYERFIEIDGDIYHHLIVPGSGKPGSGFLSVTVVMEDSSALADAYSTALFIMGKEKAMEFISTKNGIGVFIVFPDKTIYYNDVFKELVHNLNIAKPSSKPF